MNEEIIEIKEEWAEKVKELEEPGGIYFNNKHQDPYLELAKEYESKIKEVKEKYNTQE